MTRFATILAPLALAAVAALAPAAATAQPTGYYVATPAAAPTRTAFITNEMVWKWSDTAFVANQGPHRDAITCQLIAQRAGKLSAFTAAGTAFDADALAKCNARAK